MESILARALEYTLKYWLKSFTRDQFKLQGRTAQLSDLDINGDVLHASMGLPPALNVATARVGKLEITLPAVSYVQVEPIVIHIDKLDLVLQENADKENNTSTCSVQSTVSAAKASGYGFADKIADGMTVEVGTVNLLVETRGGSRNQGGATWSPPLASITIRNLLLYTTNENWKVVNLKEARDFSNNKDFIYVFKKLEWGSLSIDLLPHPDMFSDERITSSSNGSYKRDDDGAKRLFFGGERFLEGISGQAHITVQRTQLNSPLGLEVQLHIPEAVCPALSEPGLRALLRFMTGFYVCLNRGDVDPKAQQRATEAAGRSLVSIIVDHIFLCIKDAEFQLELLMQSLFFSRSSVSDGENTRNLSRIIISGLFLRDTFSHPPCTLIQPSMFSVSKESLGIPEFGENFCPPIYPLECENWQLNDAAPLICLHSLQITPSPAPPIFASQTVINCQPLTIVLQEESCLRISSFIADGILVNPGDVLPDFSVNSLKFSLKEFDLTVPLNTEEMEIHSNLFSGARLHVEDLIFVQSPSIKCKLLNLDKDPACFSLWECQPIDASQRKLTTQVSHLSLSLETCTDTTEMNNNADWSNNLWRCVELHDVCFEAAMVTADGNPLLTVPPPEGIVRIGVTCQEYSSNASVQQIFFVLGLYAYFDQVSEKITKVSKTKGRSSNDSSGTKLTEKLPSDTAVILAVTKLNLQFLEESPLIVQGMPLVQFVGDDFFVKVSHRTLGGAFVVSTNLNWGSVCISCVDQDVGLSSQMRTVFWIDNQIGLKKKIPFLDIRIIHVMPYNMKDVECHSLSVTAKIYGVRLGGGMNYTESLMHRFGILGPDGGPGEGLSKGVRKLSSGPFAKLFKSSHAKANQENGECSEDDDLKLLEVGMPDDVDVAVELNNWLFALEGNQEMHVEEPICSGFDIGREERCWHTTFRKLLINGKSKNTHDKFNVGHATRRYPVELITVGIEDLQALKPRLQRDLPGYDEAATNSKIIESDGSNEGVNIEVSLIISQPGNIEAVNWIVENVKFSVKQPIEAVVKKEELEHLVSLCRSEIDSMGRIAVGILRLLKLDKSIGQATINQLSNLGTDSLDKIFTPEKLSRQSSNNSISLTPRSMESTISLLEVEVLESQHKCLALITELGKSEFTAHKQDIEHLNQKLESMQSLLTKLRTMI